MKPRQQNQYINLIFIAAIQYQHNCTGFFYYGQFHVLKSLYGDIRSWNFKESGRGEEHISTESRVVQWLRPWPLTPLA